MKHDVDFAVPFRHRVRFTTDLTGDQFSVLVELLESESRHATKVLVAIDDEVAACNSLAMQMIDRLSQVTGIQVVNCQPFNPADSESTPALLVPGGESCKNDSEDVERLLAQINRFDLDRRSYVIAIGGGAVLDAVGYAAAIAHRGIRLIRIPTTTLAQDDSGVGVKNAINYFNKKNWIGTFAVPWAVINDASLLETLGDRDFRCGFSEAIKVFLLKSPTDFEFLCQHATQVGKRQMEVSFDVIQRSCLWHLKHISQGGDPFEMLEARPLDFGHWSAHRMEPLTNYELRHGEAVGIGVLLDCVYSHRVHGFPEADLIRVLQCFRDLGLPVWHPVLKDTDEVLTGLEEFRQHLGGRLTVTMLQAVGQAIDVHEIDDAQMRESIRQLAGLERKYSAALAD